MSFPLRILTVTRRSCNTFQLSAITGCQTRAWDPEMIGMRIKMSNEYQWIPSSTQRQGLWLVGCTNEVMAATMQCFWAAATMKRTNTRFGHGAACHSRDAVAGVGEKEYFKICHVAATSGGFSFPQLPKLDRDALICIVCLRFSIFLPVLVPAPRCNSRLFLDGMWDHLRIPISEIYRNLTFKSTEICSQRFLSRFRNRSDSDQRDSAGLSNNSAGLWDCARQLCAGLEHWSSL